MTLEYSDVYALAEMSFIAGNDYTLFFKITDENGNPGNVSGASFVWYLADFDQRAEPQLTYPGEIIAADEIKVVIPSEDTLNLSGRFVQQISISESGKQYRPLQGIVVILPAII